MSTSSTHILSDSFSRSLSRASSRSSLRAPSPALSTEDPVAVRNHIATLRHTIRHQQAQLSNLEEVARTSRPFSSGTMTTTASSHSPSSSTLDLTSETASASTAPSSFTHGSPSKMRKRSSLDKLHSIAPDSGLPLPIRESIRLEGVIREGVPMEFGTAPVTLGHHKRVSSPTRSYSRIPVSAVGNARVLADEGTSTPSRASLAPSIPPAIDVSLAMQAGSSQPGTPLSPSPNNKRLSMTPGGTTKVLADLQTGVINARNALENTKAQLRVSQRSVAQLTRQTEDMKEGRERLRLENEGLNNVVARKERLLQEVCNSFVYLFFFMLLLITVPDWCFQVLERARKAEAEAATLKAQLKNETTASKKSIREMENALTESTALSQKSEREYITLRDSLKSMAEAWKHDTDRLREEMTKREEKVRLDAETMGRKYRKLVEEIKSRQDPKAKEDIKSLKAENEQIRTKIDEALREELAALRKEMDRVAGDGDEANETAKTLAAELARLRRMMQAAGRSIGDKP